MNKYLLFSSIGNSSKHNMWLESKNRIYDIVLCYYGDDDTYYKNLEEKSSSDFKVYRNKGFKWPNFYKYIQTMDINKYNYVWIPDDDLEIKGDLINEMFLTLEKNSNIKVAIPSTSYDSVSLSLNRKDRHDCKKYIEYKNFVECGLLCFHTSLFNNKLFIKLLKSTYTGWFFDLGLKYCFNEIDRKKSIAVLHNIIVRHPKRNEPSDLDKEVPRRERHTYIYRFIRNGIPKHMLKFKRIITYNYIPNNSICKLCKINLKNNQ